MCWLRAGASSAGTVYLTRHAVFVVQMLGYGILTFSILVKLPQVSTYFGPFCPAVGRIQPQQADHRTQVYGNILFTCCR